MAKFDKIQDSNIIIVCLEIGVDAKVSSLQNHGLTFWETESFLFFLSKLAAGYISHAISKDPK